MDREQSVLAALADELRVRILAITRERPASVTELASGLGRPKGTVGYHVKVLERAGLVRVVRTTPRSSRDREVLRLAGR